MHLNSIGVVIPAYNAEQTITGVIKELLAQGFDAIQVVVTPEDPLRKERLIRWYGRLGFVDTGRLLLDFAPGAPG